SPSRAYSISSSSTICCRAKRRCGSSRACAARPAREGGQATCRCWRRTSRRAAWREKRHVARWPRNGKPRAPKARRSRNDTIEQMRPGAVLDLDDPQVGIEADLARQIGFDVRFRHRLTLEARAEGAVGRTRVLERSLRRGTVKLGSAV